MTKITEITEQTIFQTLSNLDCKQFIEVRSNGQVNLDYISWAVAWREINKALPNSKITYKIHQFGEGIEQKPYQFDPLTGYMIYTTVTIDNSSHTMYLPAMDSRNNAMKDKAYEIKTKYKTVTVEPATMFDINKTIQRCLVKNFALFGFGISLYAGEDLPEQQSPEEVKKQQEQSDRKKNARYTFEELKDKYENCKSYDEMILIWSKDLKGSLENKTITKEEYLMLEGNIKEEGAKLKDKMTEKNNPLKGK